MDLGAYTNIEDLEKLLELNNIEIKRLRGLRLMALETPTSKETIDKMIDQQFIYEVRDMFMSEYRFSKFLGEWCSCWCSDLKYKADYYCPGCNINWKAIHGKLRKKIKFMRKQIARKQSAQYKMFNKYCGREDVLYIHTRTGGGNWSYFGCNEYYSKPWFLEKVDDCFDSTYCDIYAKIDPSTIEKLKDLETNNEGNNQ